MKLEFPDLFVFTPESFVDKPTHLLSLGCVHMNVLAHTHVILSNTHKVLSKPVCFFLVSQP